MRPMQSDLDTTAADVLDPRTLLFGRDPTPGIVSVSAGRDGRATIWRRVTDSPSPRPSPGETGSTSDSRVVLEEDRFPSWLFLADASILAPLKPERLDRSELLAGVPRGAVRAGRRRAPGRRRVPPPRPDHPHAPRSRRRCWRRIASASGGAAARGLADLRGVVYARPLVEQYLAISGRTYFKGMTFDGLRRLQFDLETTGLDPEHNTHLHDQHLGLGRLPAADRRRRLRRARPDRAASSRSSASATRTSWRTTTSSAST